MFNKIKEYNYLKISDYFFLLFPIILLCRSAILNLYLCVVSLFFFYLFLKNKNNYYKFLNATWVKYLLLFYFYIVLSSFFYENFYTPLIKSFFLIRFILLSFFIYIFVSNLKKIIHLTCIFYSFILLIVCFDLWLQVITGKNIFNFPGPVIFGRYGGIFGDELIIGAYLTYISLPIIFYFCKYLVVKKSYFNYYIFFFILVTFCSILISGERINFLVFLSGVLIIFFYSFNLKYLFRIVAIITVSFIIIIFSSSSLRNKYNSFYLDLINFNDSNHGKLIFSALDVWKKNKLFGVGLKNYRIICEKNKINSFTKKTEVCSSHPHNFYLEILSETGLVGFSLFFLFLFFFLDFIRKKKKIINIKSLPFFYGGILVCFFYLFPFKSSGSFFSTFNASFFWFCVGIILLSTRKTSKINLNN